MDDQKIREIVCKDRLRNIENIENLISFCPCKMMGFVIEAQQFLHELKMPYQEELQKKCIPLTGIVGSNTEVEFDG